MLKTTIGSQKNMIKLRKLSLLSVLKGPVLKGPVFMVLVLTGLISCDDKATTTAPTTASTTDAQQFPKFDNFQSPSEIDQLKARLFDNPQDFDALDSLGDLYFESGQYLEAIQTYDKALLVNPLCTDCLNDKGLSLFYLGDANAAINAFDQAIAIDPGYAHVWLSKGFVLTSAGRYEEATGPLNKVKELDTTGRLSRTADEFLAKGSKKNPR
jgi:tetratricopeptide (TPR) repeat protein